MDKSIISSIIALLFLLVSGTALAEPPEDLVALTRATFICGFNDNVLPEQASGAANAAIQSISGRGRHVYSTAFIGFSAYMSENAAANLAEHNPNIAFCEPNGLGQAGGKPAQAGAKGGKGKPPSETDPEQQVPWGVIHVGGPLDGTGKTAWIIDSGVDVNNPDLNIDLDRGVNYVSKGKYTLQDGNGHGTHVAGTLAAIDNDIGVVGVAAGATVVPVRVMHNSGWAAIDDMVAGIDHVAGNASEGDVANMSIWAYGHYESLHDATLGLANVIPFIVIAGNDYEDINDRPSEPSHAVHENLYVVSAIDNPDNRFSDFSNWGHADHTSGECIDNPDYPCGTVNIAAPGRDILSLQPGGSLDTWYGTSMAAPHVAGVILATETNPAPTYGTADNDPDGAADPVVKAPAP